MNFLRKSIKFIILIVIIGLPLSKTLVHIVTEAWWFDAVGFAEVFWTKLTWQILAWVVTFVVYTLFLWGNYRLAMHWTRHRSFRFLEDSNLAAYANKLPNYLALVFIVLIALGAASASASAWETILKYLYPSDFGDRDPIYQQDIGFYIFKLPLYEGIWGWLVYLFAWGLIITALVYGFKAGRNPLRQGRQTLSNKAKTHLSLICTAIAFLVAIDFWLKRYRLLYSAEGVVFGAGYTDVHARIFAYWVMGILSLAIAVLLVLSVIKRGFTTLPVYGLGFYVVALVLVNIIYPWFQQQFIVEPNELAKEKSYIEHNIKLTQRAYHLDDVQKQNYAAQTHLSRQDLQENQPTIRNIRLWDYRPLLSTYRQLQEIRAGITASGHFAEGQLWA